LQASGRAHCLHQPWFVVAWHVSPSPGRIAVGGELGLADGSAIWDALRAETASVGAGQRVVFDLSAAHRIDGAVMALIVEVRDTLIARGAEVEVAATSPQITAIAHLYGADRAPPTVTPVVKSSPIVRLGKQVATLGSGVRRGIELLGELVAGTFAVIRWPRLGGWRDLGTLIARAGSDGIVIVLVLDFLVGFVMAFQSTRQLQNFGANVYVADIVGIAMTRELAPLITAIIVSGRSGAGFAAELGTMRVSEEIDALHTMGFAPVPFLVVPRVVALAIVAPVLVLLGDIAGIVGGVAVAQLDLGVHPRAFLSELRSVIVPSDIWTGLVKAFVFGIAIAVIGCEQGLATRGAASGVGRSTTTTVVICLFALVGIDTALTMVFRGAGV
jgi:phospholipid/cholesterol/gamma-HCH transport system permease protein